MSRIEAQLRGHCVWVRWDADVNEDDEDENEDDDDDDDDDGIRRRSIWSACV